MTDIVNVTFHAVHAATVSWSMLPLGFYAFGMPLATPGLLLTGLDQFPQMRGLAGSCQAFAMVLLAGLITQLAPTFGGRALALGLVQGVLCIAVSPRALHDPTLRTECIVPPALWTRSGPTWRSQRNAQQ